MFRVIKLDFYDDFKCLMSECTDNCCDEDWDIYIDEETYELYKNAGIPDIDSYITSTTPRKLIKKNHKCPFITEEGLCRFHRDYGEKYLSTTCWTYPRFASSYGDVYLETLGLSCPATVNQLLHFDREIVFPSKVYYEEESELGTNPKRTEEESVAYSIITQFVPGRGVLDTYKDLLGDRLEQTRLKAITRAELLTILSNIMAETPSEKYVSKLYPIENRRMEGDDQQILGDERITDIEKKLGNSCLLFSCNVNRMLLFEHLLLDSHSESPDRGTVILQGLIIWILLLIAFEEMDISKAEYSEKEIVECTYRLMRIVDHGGNVPDLLVENIRQ